MQIKLCWQMLIMWRNINYCRRFTNIFIHWKCVIVWESFNPKKRPEKFSKHDTASLASIVGYRNFTNNPRKLYKQEYLANELEN